MVHIIDPDSEEALENAATDLFAKLGWQVANCQSESATNCTITGRDTTSEVVLTTRLRPALERLNPELPLEAISAAVEELTRDRSAMSLVQANREVYDLLKNGVKVSYRDEQEEEAERYATVRVIDWEEPYHNDFFLASQLWVSGEMYTRRADLVGFVNGLPLLFIELKASHRRLRDAFEGNLRDYKQTIPQLFWYNAFILLSNGSDTLVGTVTAPWEHFSEWKKINSEGEEGVISLDTVIRGTCEPARLLDIVENFILFRDAQGGTQKVIARYHQYLGVNNAIDAVHAMEENKGRLGVFWHTQGSGKSFSMIFFAQKILRTVPGNWTFVVVTDRTDLDDQIYKNFASVGAVTEGEERVRAGSGEHLKQLLREDHRYLFTLIQKFRTDNGAPYPTLSERDDIIVMTDEAHRSQYDIFAANMRSALPNAAFIGFTGTPLMAGEEKTREVFGNYVSIYDFKQSMEDGATVPLYFENRAPELQLVNPNFKEDMERLLDEAMLDEAEERKLEREFAREYHLITRDERLETVAEDIVDHFLGRGYQGKAMVVSIDKATAVRMYDKVQHYWRQRLEALRNQRDNADEAKRERLEQQIAYLEGTDMAVVVSQGQNEVEEFAKRGLDIVPHRRRMVYEALDEKFKDPDDPLRLVFVCAMWMTGFDAPAVSTIYLDKPMRNHTLMQTIARANRVFGEKNNGLIVAYLDIFSDLKRALAIYGSGGGGEATGGETPVQSKEALIEELRKAIRETQAFMAARGVDLDTLQAAVGFERIKLRDDAVEALIENDEGKLRYLALVAVVDRLFKAILPDTRANEFGPTRKLLVVLAEQIRSLMPDVDISEVMAKIEALLDESVAAEGYVIHAPSSDTILEEREAYRVDLSKIDFDALRQRFQEGRKRTEAEKLRGMLNSKLKQMVRVNKSRMDYLQRFQEMIDAYNRGAVNVDIFFAELMQFAKSLQEEEVRHVKEQLSEEELALFDLLTKPEIELTRAEEQTVKEVAREMLDTLKNQKLVLDWRKRQRDRAAVKLAIEETLDKLPERYSQDLWEQKVEAVYQHVYDNYYGDGRSVYARAG